jgi:hypothetical protein
MEMARGAWTSAWALAATITAAAAWAGEPAAPESITIRLDDLAGTPARDLDAAKSEMSRIFHTAGVDVNWVGTTALPQTGELTLILLTNNTRPASERGDVAGEAIREAARAYVFCDRLKSMGKDLPIDANVLLGRVMAHEIGHLLLPPKSHSRIGIMRAQMDLSKSDVDTFTNDQVLSLRSAIRGAHPGP